MEEIRCLLWLVMIFGAGNPRIWKALHCSAAFSASAFFAFDLNTAPMIYSTTINRSSPTNTTT